MPDHSDLGHFDHGAMIMVRFNGSDNQPLDEAHYREELSATSSSLLDRAKRADPVAWDRIVECYSGMVFRWCRAAGLRPEEARDVGQDVFLAAYRSLPKFAPRYASGSFRGWLYAITRSKFLDYVNHFPTNMRATGGSEIRELMEQFKFPDDDEQLLREDLVILHRSVEQFISSAFSQMHCEAFFRVVVEGQSPADVAERMGMTRNAVYLACTRIRKRVKEEFGDLLDTTSVF